MKRAALFLVLLVSPLNAATLRVVGPTAVDQFKLVQLRVDGDPKDAGFIWDVFPDGIADLDESIPGRLIFTGPPGVYTVKLRVVDFTSKTITSSKLTVTIGGARPPGPTPIPPTPTDPLYVKVKAAYDVDPAPDKAILSAKLSVFYNTSATSKTSVYDQSITTVEMLRAKVRAQEAAVLTPTQLSGVRQVIGAELNSTLPVSGPLTEEVRYKIATEFYRAAAALDALTP